VDEVHYYDEYPWPSAADGGGSSLELRDPYADNSVPQAWDASQEGHRSQWQTYRYQALGADPRGASNPRTFQELVLTADEDLMKDYDRRMILTMEKEVPLMDGALEAIQFFMEKNIPVALASCTNYNLIEAAMNRHDLRKYFKLMVSASGVMPGKPHPEVYIQTAAKMGADPTRCLAIEDSFFGVISAKAAKMKVVAMPDPSEYNQDRFSAADAKIRSLREIDDELFKKLQ